MPAVEDLTARLTGRFVILEPASAEHEEGLWEAAKDDSPLFQWMPVSVIDDDWPALRPRLEARVEKHLDGSA